MHQTLLRIEGTPPRGLRFVPCLEALEGSAELDGFAKRLRELLDRNASSPPLLAESTVVDSGADLVPALRSLGYGESDARARIARAKEQLSGASRVSEEELLRAALRSA